MIWKFITIVCLAMMPLLVLSQRTFVHPGISHKKSDLDRMKIMEQAGVEPWKTSYTNLLKNGYASYNYVVRWNKDSTYLNTRNSTSYNKIMYDGLAAYYNALAWSISGDVRYADKCVEIFKAWSNIKRIVTGGTDCLDAGRVIWKVLEAAEIIKSTYSGWLPADIANFKAMLVYPGYSATAEPTAAIASKDVSFYWYMYNGDYGRHGNQGLFGIRGIMAMGIFMDNEIMYDRALRYLKGLPHRTDDLPYPSGPPIVSASRITPVNSYYDEYTPTSPYKQTTTADYGYNEVMANYIWDNGQGQESSRDQSHGLLGVSIISTICEMAWSQGDDLYGFLNNRPLLGLEFYYRYNVSYNYSFPDQLTPWEPTIASGEFKKQRDRSGRWTSKKINPYTAADTTVADITRGTMVLSSSAPIYEMVLGHYKSRLGLSRDKLKWTIRGDSISRAVYGYEQQGFQVDHPGFGGLTFHRPDNCPGDPCSFTAGKPVFAMNILPGVVEAENFDYFPSAPEGKTYHDLSAGNAGAVYRTAEDVDIETCSEGGYDVNNMEPGEWITYTVATPYAAKYDIIVRYGAANGNGKIRFAFNGIDKTADVTLPFGAPYSTGVQDWKDYTVATAVPLDAGVQSMKIYVTGTASGYSLNKIKLMQSQTITFSPLSSKKVGDGDFSLYPYASASSQLTVTFASSNTAVATVNGWLVHIVGAGTTDITASQAGNASFSAAPDVKQTLTVSASALVSNLFESPIILTPNPTIGSFTVQLPGRQLAGVSIAIYDTMGKEVFKNREAQLINNFDLSKCPLGVYFVRIRQGRKLFVRKIVKQ
jgi:hypothetical protein